MRRRWPALLVVTATALASAVIGGIAPARVAAAASTWTNSATTGPNPESGAAMAWDQATSSDVLFTTSGQTWTWNGSAWSQLSPSASPPPRRNASMAYDVAHGVVVLFGGVSGSTYLNDSWTWNGTTWTNWQPTLSPPARGGAAMAWDSGVGQRVMLFGGYEGPGIFYADTWAWDGNAHSWNELVANYVTVGAGPSPRTLAQMSDDPANTTVVLFGGASPQGALGDTWVWYDSSTGGHWTQASPLTPPPARSAGALAYASAAGAQGPVLFGGSGAGSVLLQDSWGWDGRGWSPSTPSGGPTPRREAAAAAGPNGSVVIFGGSDASGAEGDTWTWSGGIDAAPLPAPTIVSCPAAGPSPSTYALPTTTGTSTLRGAAAVSHPGLYIGTALTASQIYDADAEQQITAGSQDNLIASSNQMYWSADEQEPSVFDFCDGDQFVGYAQAYHQSLRLHNLIAGNEALGQAPQWITKPSTPWTATSLSAAMKQYITTVIDHYRGKVSVYDVVNEALDPAGNPSQNIFQQVIGYPNYVVEAFQDANAANPQATLLYDDYLDWYGNKFTQLESLITDLHNAGTHVDAVGMEMFGAGTWILPGSGSDQSADLQTAMSTLAAAPYSVKTAITQMSVPFFGTVNPTAAQLTQQANVYNYVMSACLAPASNCFMFMTWGVSDTYSLPTSLEAAVLLGGLSPNYQFGGALFDVAYQPRPAFNSVLSLLQ